MSLLATGCSGGIGKYLSVDYDINFRNFQKDTSLIDLKTVAKNSSLLHLAAMTNLREVQDNPADSFKVNVTSTIDLFRNFAANGGKRFVFASTGHAYGITAEGRRSAENDMLNPLSLYAEQKISAETGLMREAENSGIELIILRIFSVFGKGMKNHFLPGRIESGLSNLGFSQKIFNSDDVRDFSSPEDIARSVYKSATIPISNLLIVNLCSGLGITVKEVVNSNFPNVQNHCFVAGNSNTPRLVGDPSLQNAVFEK